MTPCVEETHMMDIPRHLPLTEQNGGKEADWLALVLANVGCGIPLSEYIDEDVNGMSPPAPEHWREAARNAVEKRK